MAEQSYHIKSIYAITKHKKPAIRSKEKHDNQPARRGQKDAIIIQKKRYMVALCGEFQGFQHNNQLGSLQIYKQEDTTIYQGCNNYLLSRNG